jgi:hypothetical protein
MSVDPVIRLSVLLESRGWRAYNENDRQPAGCRFREVTRRASPKVSRVALFAPFTSDIANHLQIQNSMPGKLADCKRKVVDQPANQCRVH